MNNHKDHSYSLTRGLGGLFIFASLQFLERDEFTTTLILLAIGVINLLPYLWVKRWTAIGLYGANALASAIVFYEFILMDTKYIQWLWLAVFVYYIIRLRDLFRQDTGTGQPEEVNDRPQTEEESA
jgi:hypothetical protein